MGLQPSSHTPKLNQIEAGQSQPKNQSPVSGPICNHRASGQAIKRDVLLTQHADNKGQVNVFNGDKQAIDSVPENTRHIDPMLVECCTSVVDGGPILKQHWVNVS